MKCIIVVTSAGDRAELTWNAAIRNSTLRSETTLDRQTLVGVDEALCAVVVV